MKPKRILRQQGGIALVEALVAIVIFAFGVLAMVGLQSAAVRQVSDVQRFCEAERRYHQELPSAPRRRPHGPSEMHTAYMMPGE